MYYNGINNISDRDIRIIKALEQKTIQNGATKFEEQNAKDKIESIRSKYKEDNNDIYNFLNNKNNTRNEPQYFYDIYNSMTKKSIYCNVCHSKTDHFKIINSWMCRNCSNETPFQYKCPICGKSHHGKIILLFINYHFYNVTMCRECNTLFDISYENEDDCKIIQYTQVTLPIYKIFIDLYDLYMNDRLHFKLAYLNSKLIDKLKFISYYIFRKMTNILPR